MYSVNLSWCYNKLKNILIASICHVKLRLFFVLTIYLDLLLTSASFFCIIDQEVGWGREVGREGAFIYTISSHSPSPIQGKLCLNPQIHIFRNKKVIGCINDGISWKFVFGSYDLQFIPGSLFNQSCCNQAPCQKENKYLGSIISNAWSASENINSQFIECFYIILYCFPL